MGNELGLTAQWSTIYRADWDNFPQHYVDSGLLKRGHSRRLVRFDDRLHGFKAYIGVYHADPSQWGAAGPADTHYFLSYFVNGQTIALHTYDTLLEARTALMTVHTQLVMKSQVVE